MDTNVTALPDASDLRLQREEAKKAEIDARHNNDLQRVTKEILEAHAAKRTQITTGFIVESVRNILRGKNYEIIQHQGDGPSNPGVTISWK